MNKNMSFERNLGVLRNTVWGKKCAMTFAGKAECGESRVYHSTDALIRI